MTKPAKKYSSSFIQELAENTKWNFWSADWSKRIIVEWAGENKPDIKKLTKDVRKLVGMNFKYERALNNDPFQYTATSDGLKPYFPVEQHEKENKYNIWSNPNRRGQTQSDECEYCGKKCGKNALHVHISTSGCIYPVGVHSEQLEIRGIESQGCFPIGSGCAKKLFGAEMDKFTFRYE